MFVTWCRYFFGAGVQNLIFSLNLGDFPSAPVQTLVIFAILYTVKAY
jgi:hypothetical protein